MSLKRSEPVPEACGALETLDGVVQPHHCDKAKVHEGEHWCICGHTWDPERGRGGRMA